MSPEFTKEKLHKRSFIQFKIFDTFYKLFLEFTWTHIVSGFTFLPINSDKDFVLKFGKNASENIESNIIKSLTCLFPMYPFMRIFSTL